MCAFTRCIISVLVVCVAMSLPIQGIRSSSTRRRHRNGKPPARTDTQLADGTQRTPFQRILVLCSSDDSCHKKEFCHGGEGRKSCLPCRKPGRRCHRDGMCCRNNECVDGVCRSKKTSQSLTKPAEIDYDEEGSIAQDTKTNMFRLQEDDRCENSFECDEGLCCAQHYWLKICKPVLVEGDICTKKRGPIDLFQRCDCGAGLACKRNPNPEFRLHYCLAVKVKLPVPEVETTSPSPPSKESNESPVRKIIGSSKEIYDIDHDVVSTTERERGSTDVLHDLLIQ